MADPAVVPCPWPVDPGCFEDGWDALDDEVKVRSVALASQTLRRLTGYRVGACPIKVRPCRKSCAGTPAYSFYGWYGRWGPGYSIPDMGLWVNSCGCGGACHCGAQAGCVVRLPAPASSVSEVKVDGAVLDPADYALMGGGRLLWTGTGDCPWPTCQDLSLPDTEPGTFSVTYVNSYAVDASGAYAAGVLANEFAKACAGKNCSLPNGVRTVARQGVTYDIQPGAFPDGFTGITSVDTYISLWNPGAIRPPVVWSPDVGSRVGW